MPDRRARHFLFSVLAVVLATGARAQWSTNPALNFAIADRTGEEVIPLVGSTSDGGTYVAWFDNTSGAYVVRLQRLNAAGMEQWAHNGLVISAHPQNTALFGWDMIVDSSDNAVLVFSDIRDGGDLDVFAYRIGPAGQFLWGANGVQLSAEADFDPAPRVAEASDGDFVFVWQRDPSAGDGDVRMQRLSPAGVPRFGGGPLPVVVSAGEDPGFVGIVPADNGNVVVSYLRNIRTFSSPRHVRAQKFSPTGSPVWGAPVVVYDLFSLPIGYFPTIQPDGAGGAFLLWHRSNGSLHNSFLQHLDASGSELYGDNGVEVSTNATMHHIDPTLSRDPDTGDSFVFWSEQVANQSQRGIFGQKFSPAGVRQWGSGGRQFLPVNTTFKSSPRSVPHGGGAMVFLNDQPSGTDRLIGLRIDASGNSVWGASPVPISTATSTKARYPVTIDFRGVAKIVWEDNRSAFNDIYGQNVNPDGSLGVLPVPGSIGPTLAVGRAIQTPQEIEVRWSPSCSAGALDYGIYEGGLGDFASHVKKVCTDDGGDRVEVITPAPGSTYYLLVPISAAAEGSYGLDSNHDERAVPADADRCVTAQDLTACAP